MATTQRNLTLKEVAEKAGVSVSTVSLVLNNRPGVSEDRRKKIQTLLGHLGYRRNSQGRPAAAQTGTMAFVVYDAVDIEASHNPFFSKIQWGIESEARRLGYGLRVISIREGDDVLATARQLRSQQTVGVVLDASVMPAEAFRPFYEAGVPVVLLDNEYPEFAVDSVVIDNYTGTLMAVQHLQDLGHTNIGMVTTSIHNHNFAEREAAFHSRLQSGSAGAGARSVLRVRPTLAGSYEDCERELAKTTELPTAFFAGNDIIASGLVRVLAKNGVRIPQDVSVVGFDDLAMSEILSPPLSTVRVFKARLAALAVQRLVERVSSPPPETVSIRVKTEFVVRDSTAPPQR